MRRTIQAAAAEAAAATLDSEVVRRSLAAAAWRQVNLRGSLQGVIEEEEEEAEQDVTSSSTQQQQQQGESQFAVDHVRAVRAVFGSYSHRGILHDNEDRVSVCLWGLPGEEVIPASRRCSSSSQSACSRPAIPPETASAAAAAADDKKILETAAGGRGLDYEWGLPPPDLVAKASPAAAAATATEKAAVYGQQCELPPPVAAGLRLSLQGVFAAELKDIQEAAAAAAAAAAADPKATCAAAAVDGAIEFLVGAPPAPPWEAAAAAAEQQHRWGLAALRRRRNKNAIVEGAAISFCGDPEMGRGSSSSSCNSGSINCRSGSSNIPPSVLFTLCDGHDSHEGSAFVSKVLPLLAYRRLAKEQQLLLLLQQGKLHSTARTLFSDLDTLMR